MREGARPVFTLSVPSAEAGGREDGLSMHPDDMASLGWRSGDAVMVTGVARTVGRLMPRDEPGRAGTVAMAPLLCAGAGARAGETVTLERVAASRAERVLLASTAPAARPEEGSRPSFWRRLLGDSATEERADRPEPDAALLDGRIVTPGSLVRQGAALLRVIETRPEGAVIIDAGTELSVLDPSRPSTSYQDIGGLAAEVARVREMVELPLKHPEVFARLGIDPPRGLLLYGPPGSGKTLIARAIAHQTDAFFIHVDGPEIIQKHYGESEELLRNVFAEAQKHPAAVLFFDEIDALAPNRETVLGDVEKRVVGQLLALMDGVAARGRIVVMAATNLPNSVDSALRRPGRFDREIAIHPPGRAGRLEILKIHTRFMPLAADVELDRIAAVTHGFLGADLAALCREAAMLCARDGTAGDATPFLFVRMEHFRTALDEFRLSTIRELSSDVTETRWEEIGGLEEPKRLLKEALEWPLVYGARFEHAGARPPSGVLLTGRPGTGKTLLAQAVGSSTEVNFIVAKGPELLSKWVGESERGIREVFRRARQSAPSILFFDEIDAIAPARGKDGGGAEVGDRMVGQLLLELGSLDRASGVTVLAATNRPDLVDPALLRPGRFDLVIALPEPDREARRAILEVHCAGSPLGKDVDLSALAETTEGMTGADLAALCQRARMSAIAGSVAREPGQGFRPFVVEARHFRAALEAVTSVRAAIAHRRLVDAA